jgi:hypothetical protein
VSHPRRGRRPAPPCGAVAGAPCRVTARITTGRLPAQAPRGHHHRQGPLFRASCGRPESTGVARPRRALPTITAMA